MPKRKVDLSVEAVDKAIERATAGKGRQLAEMIKACSVDDLASGFGQAGEFWTGDYPWAALRTVLAVCGGRRKGRADVAVWLKDARREYRAKAKAEAVE